MNQIMQTLRELSAKIVHIILRVDLANNLLQACLQLFWRLEPRFRWCALAQQTPKPRYRSFMQKRGKRRVRFHLSTEIMCRASWPILCTRTIRILPRLFGGQAVFFDLPRSQKQENTKLAMAAPCTLECRASGLAVGQQTPSPPPPQLPRPPFRSCPPAPFPGFCLHELFYRLISR